MNGWTKYMAEMEKWSKSLEKYTIILGWHKIYLRKSKDWYNWLREYNGQWFFHQNDILSDPVSGDLFSVGESENLRKDKAKEFHTVVAEGLLVWKIARPDLHPNIAALYTHVNNPK